MVAGLLVGKPVAVVQNRANPPNFVEHCVPIALKLVKVVLEDAEAAVSAPDAPGVAEVVPAEPLEALVEGWVTAYASPCLPMAIRYRETALPTEPHIELEPT